MTITFTAKQYFGYEEAAALATFEKIKKQHRLSDAEAKAARRQRKTKKFVRVEKF